MAPKDLPRIDEKTAAGDAKQRRQAAIRELKAVWDRKLECLNRRDASRKVDAMMDACGRAKKRPIAGSTF